VLAGRVDEGLPLLEEAVERGLSVDAMATGYAMRLSRLSEGYLLGGRIDDARARAQQALELARTQKERANEAWALRLLGETASHAEPPAFAATEAYLRDALGLATELAMRPLVAHCHFGLGKLYRSASKHEPAREHLVMAATLYREMEMRHWLVQAEAESR
jgi:tetratricopeptide (TPR) repeat protein